MAKSTKKKPAPVAVEAELEAGEVIGAMRDFNTEDSERASDAGESRQRIGAFLEKTKLNAKAFSHLRMGLRIKKESNRLDWLRSLKMMLPMIEAEIKATTTTDAFDTPLEAIKAAEAEKKADNVIRPWGEMTADQQQAAVAQFEGGAKPSYEADPDFDADVEAFDQAAAETLGDEA